jgi:hypothetical protein
MKKITFILVITLLSGFGMTAKATDRVCPDGAELNKFLMSATTAYTYNSVTYSTANANAVQDGDVVILNGAYNWSALINGLPISVTVKADPSLTVRPVITYTFTGTASYFIKPSISSTNTKVITFDGVDIIGTSTISATGFLNSAPTAGGSNTKLVLNNCVLRRFAVAAFISTYAANTAGAVAFGDIIITNSRIIGFGYLNNGAAVGSSLQILF